MLDNDDFKILVGLCRKTEERIFQRLLASALCAEQHREERSRRIDGFHDNLLESLHRRLELRINVRPRGQFRHEASQFGLVDVHGFDRRGDVIGHNSHGLVAVQGVITVHECCNFMLAVDRSWKSALCLAIQEGSAGILNTFAF